MVIEVSDPETCATCGKVAECRPYGPGGATICFKCGQQDKAGTEQRMRDFMMGEADA